MITDNSNDKINTDNNEKITVIDESARSPDFFQDNKSILKKCGKKIYHNTHKMKKFLVKYFVHRYQERRFLQRKSYI